MATEQRQKMGALWRKEQRGGGEHLSGEVTIDGRVHRIVVFRNGYKDNDRKPDFVIYADQDRRSAASSSEDFG